MGRGAILMIHFWTMLVQEQPVPRAYQNAHVKILIEAYDAEEPTELTVLI
jgi:hypothetical protein